MKFLAFLLLFPSLALADGISLSPWGNSIYDIPINDTYLRDTSISQDDFNAKLLGGQKHVAEIKQQYDDQMRDYNLHQQYSADDLTDSMQRFNQAQSANQGVYNSALDSARKIESQPYIDNLHNSAVNGDVAKPVLYSAGGVAVLTGNQIETKVNSNTKITTQINLTNQTSWVKIDSSYFGIKMNTVMNVNTNGQTGSTKIESNYGSIFASYNLNAPSDAPTAQLVGQELYQLSYSRTVPWTGSNFGVNYAGSTQVAKVFISRQIYKQIVLEIDNSWGNPSINVPEEIIIKANYGAIHF